MVFEIKKGVGGSYKNYEKYENTDDIIKEIELRKTKQLLKQTAKQINIEQIKAGLLLMAFNMDNLEDLNKKEFKEPKNTIGKPESHENTQDNDKPLSKIQESQEPQIDEGFIEAELNYGS